MRLWDQNLYSPLPNCRGPPTIFSGNLPPNFQLFPPPKLRFRETRFYDFPKTLSIPLMFSSLYRKLKRDFQTPFPDVYGSSDRIPIEITTGVWLIVSSRVQSPYRGRDHSNRLSHPILGGNTIFMGHSLPDLDPLE